MLTWGRSHAERSIIIFKLMKWGSCFGVSFKKPTKRITPGKLHHGFKSKVKTHGIRTGFHSPYFRRESTVSYGFYVNVSILL